jgi:hypothetical protein
MIPQQTTLLDNAATRVEELIIGVCDALGSRGSYGSKPACEKIPRSGSKLGGTAP